MTQQSMHGKLFQIATAWGERRNKEFVQVWGFNCRRVRGCVSIVKWFVQGLYTRGAFGKSMNPWTILYKWLILKKFSPFSKWGYVQVVQHVTMASFHLLVQTLHAKCWTDSSFCISLERWGSQTAVAYSRLGQPHIVALMSPYQSTYL